MAIEIEKKFLLNYLPFSLMTDKEYIEQGYIVREKNKSVRVRLYGNKGFITIKSDLKGILRREYEYSVPKEDAKEMLLFICEKPLIQKNRYKVLFNGLEWTIDEFKKENKGLLLAEIELNSSDQKFELPDWIGKEVSHDPKYYNVNLIRNPYSKWY